MNNAEVPMNACEKCYCPKCVRLKEGTCQYDWLPVCDFCERHTKKPVPVTWCESFELQKPE